MNKLKSIIKRLLGRPAANRSPVTIDICAETAEGYVVIGWFFTHEVQGLSLIGEGNEPIDSQTTDIERADVVAQTGKPAQGFQITCRTSQSIANIRLTASLANGQKTIIPLSLNGSESIAATGANPEAIAKIASTATGLKGSCEFLLQSSTHYFISGWMLDKESKIKGEIKTTKGDVVATIDKQIRYARKDVQDVLGSHAKISTGYMVSLKRVDTKQYRKQDLQFFVDVKGTSHPIQIQDIFYADSDAMVNAKRLLNTWTPHNPVHLSESEMFAPFLKELYPIDKTAYARRLDINGVVDNPRVSIIIPLYGRYDFIRYQMSHFNRFDEYKDVEIIYVVDDPKIAAPAKSLSLRIGQLYPQPFSLVMLSENVGFGLANNIGVEHANSDNLVLLNSDVLPKNSAWLAQMQSALEIEGAGIIGARLMFEDDTIQHDGMAPMSLREYPGLLFNDHPKKGWPKSLANYETEVEQTELITAACWMLKKSLFSELGGFDPAYILGDFEDSDLCFKAIAAGKTNFIHHGTELYHLERQSQNLVDSGKWKHNLTILNAITFNNRWRAQLDDIVGAAK